MIDLESEIRRIVREELARTPANDTAPHITVAEYASRRQISESTVRIAIRERRLPCLRIGRAVRVPADSEIQAPTRTAAARADAKLGR
jgi:excisionase family DNA binding protein